MIRKLSSTEDQPPLSLHKTYDFRAAVLSMVPIGQHRIVISGQDKSMWQLDVMSLHLAELCKAEETYTIMLYLEAVNAICCVSGQYSRVVLRSADTGALKSERLLVSLCHRPLTSRLVSLEPSASCLVVLRVVHVS